MNEYADKMLVVNELPPPCVHYRRCKDIFFLKFTPGMIIFRYINPKKSRDAMLCVSTICWKMVKSNDYFPALIAAWAAAKRATGTRNGEHDT